MSKLDISLSKQIQSNQDKINSIKPFEKEKLQNLRDFFKIDLTYTSNALEGNTFTLSETKILLEDGLTVGGKSLRETFEVIGHSQAYDYMFTLINNKIINIEDILELHKLFYKDIDKEQAGQYRDIQVYISGSSYPVTSPDLIPQEMENLQSWIEAQRDKYDLLEFASLLHKKFIFIHPFIDGNGRVARLLMNTALIQERYLPIAIPPILRNEYISYLEQAHIDDRNFINFIGEVYLQTQKDFMRIANIK